MAFAENKIDVTKFDSASEVTGLESKIASEENIAKNMPLSNVYGTYGSVTYTFADKTNIVCGSTAQLFNGVVESSHLDINGFRHVADDGTFINNPVDFTFSFAGNATINSFAYVGRTTNTGAYDSYIEDYAIFASDKLDTLYESTSMLYHYQKSENKTSQLISFETPVKAKFFGMRVYKAVNESYMASSPGNRQFSYLRAKEIAIFGSCEYLENEDPTDAASATTCINNLSDDSNLLNDGYEYTNTDNQPGIHISGKMDGNDYGYSSISTRATNCDFLDKNIDTHADIGLSGTDFLFIDSSGNYKANTYIDLLLELKYSAKIDKLFLAFPANIYWQPIEFYVYASDNKNTLYDNGSLKQTVTCLETVNNRFYTFKFQSKLTAKYIGVRITKGVKQPQNIISTYKSNDVAYLRISEIALFGKYDLPYYDYTATSNKGDYINQKGNSYKGDNYSFTVPLYKDGNSFDYWEINGAKTNEGTIINKNNIAVLNGTLDENHYTFKAIYKDGDTALSSNQYTIKNNKVLVPYGETSYDLSLGFNQYASSLKTVRSAEELALGKKLLSGDKLQLYKGSTKQDELEVLLKGDVDFNGNLNVTDIVSAIDNILGKTEPTQNEILATDANEDGKQTVSDIVALRNKLFTTSSYAGDYLKKTVTAKDLTSKCTGRYLVNEDDSLSFDFTGSGIEFNLNCQGDVALELSQTRDAFTYYTYTVDGVENEIQLFGVNQKQTVVLAQDLEKGNHTFKFFKQRSAIFTMNIFNVTYQGIENKAPENKDLFIEFVGDSITCGIGNLVKNTKTIGKRHENGLLAYAVKTAQKLNADYSCVSQSGYTLAKLTGANDIPSVYDHIILNDSANLYNFEDGRKPDVIVINLGTNDHTVMSNLGYNDAQKKTTFKSEAKAFVDRLISLYGNDVNIVLSYGMMSRAQYIFDAYSELASDYTGNGYNVYTLDLPQDTSGGDTHPTVEGDEAAAVVLSSFITNTVLQK